jgi:HEAT repeat protein
LADRQNDQALRAMCLRALARQKADGQDGLLEKLALDAEEPLSTQAAAALADQGQTTGELRPVLLRALRSARNPTDRACAARGLGSLRTKADIPHLIETLGDKNPAVRQAALGALIAICLDVHGTTQADWNAWWRVSRETFRVLPATADNVGLLVAKLGSASDARVRSSAEALLREIGEAALPAVAEALGEGAAAASAVDVLAAQGAPAAPRLVELLSCGNPMVAGRASQALSEIGAPAVKILRAELADRKRSFGARALAAEALGRIGDRSVVKTLVAATQSRDSRLRLAGVRALGRLGGAEANVVLLMLLKSKDGSLRQAASLALAAQGSSVVPLLGAVLDNGDHPVVFRAQAAITLGRVRDPAAAPPLAKALDATDPDIREAALRSLAQIGASGSSPSVMAAITKALRDRSPAVRVAACVAAGRLGRGRAVNALRPLLSDPNPRVKASALDGLAATQDSRVEPLLRRALTDADEGVRQHAAAGLAALLIKRRPGDAMVLVDHDDPVVRSAALRVVGRLGSPTACRALCQAATDRHADVRRMAFAALGRYPTAEAAAALARGLTDPVAANAAAAERSLAAIGRGLSVPPLLGLLAGADTRSAARAALERITGQRFGEDPQRWRAWWQQKQSRGR